MLKRLIAKLLKVHIYDSLPRGANLYEDIKQWLPKWTPQVVFDVGANEGQITVRLHDWYPQATIYSFEPNPKTFQVLINRTRELRNVQCFAYALGDASGDGTISDDSASDRCRVSIASVDSNGDTRVTIQTISQFCDELSIDGIGFVKVDTEGSDLRVLRGAEGMLREQAIDLIQVEVGMNPENHWHVPFWAMKDYLEEFGYRLFGIYGQYHEFPTNEPHLRRCDPVFISRRMIDSHHLGE